MFNKETMLLIQSYHEEIETNKRRGSKDSHSTMIVHNTLRILLGCVLLVEESVSHVINF